MLKSTSKAHRILSFIALVARTLFFIEIFCGQPRRATGFFVSEQRFR